MGAVVVVVEVYLLSCILSIYIYIHLQRHVLSAHKLKNSKSFFKTLLLIYTDFIMSGEQNSFKNSIRHFFFSNIKHLSVSLT